jgi:hypothetical protein
MLARQVLEVTLDRKPTGLVWHPSASPPLLTLHDITTVLFIQLDASTRTRTASRAHTPAPHGTTIPPAPAVPVPVLAPASSRCGTLTPSLTHPSCLSSAILCPPDQDGGEGRGPRQRPPSAAPEYVATSFSPSLPGALEGLTWSQWGRHLAVCMEGVVRVYDWPTSRVRRHTTQCTTRMHAYMASMMHLCWSMAVV